MTTPASLSVVLRPFGAPPCVKLTPSEARAIQERLHLAERLAEALKFYADDANYRARSGALGQDAEPPKATPLLAQFILKEWER